jgi:UDPglucose 6-dehydrogenase
MFGLDKKVLWGTKIGFIGLGKLGMPCAEAMVKKGFDVTGYDIVPKTSSYVEIRDSIKDVCSDRDIVFVATPTPHEDGYDGRTPTSHLPVKDFNYDAVKKVLTKCNDNMTEAQTLVLISTVLPVSDQHQADVQPLSDSHGHSGGRHGQP